MSMKLGLAVLALIAMAPTSNASFAVGLDEADLRADTFQQLYQQIRPQAGESRWMDVDWLTDLHEARRKAAAEGKPLFINSSGGAISIGSC